MRTWCICDELPVFLGGCGLVMESLKREWPFISVCPYRDPTQVPLV